MKLLNEFNQITKLRLFELEFEVDGIKDYSIYRICADKNGLYSPECLGFVDWCDCFTLDEHLQELYEICEDDLNKRILKGA